MKLDDCKNVNNSSTIFFQWYRKQLSREHLGKVLARLNYNTLTKNVNELKKCHMQCYFRLADKSEFDRPDRHLL